MDWVQLPLLNKFSTINIGSTTMAAGYDSVCYCYLVNRWLF